MVSKTSVGKWPVQLALLLATQKVAALDYGLPWAADNTWGTTATQAGKLTWFHHWQMTSVQQLVDGGAEYVPMLWGPKYESEWYNDIMPEFDANPPKHILAMNEPDIESQANMSPEDAAGYYQSMLAPLRDRFEGVQISSPQLCYDIDWMKSFMDSLSQQGGHVDFLAIHHYQGWDSIDQLTQYVENIHNLWPDLKIWMTEYGVTSESGPSEQNVQDYMIEATQWLEQTGYVDRAAWFGAFAVSNPPDDYATGLNAIFNDDGSLRDQGRWWTQGGTFDAKKRSIEFRA
ncbi:hypothetical protein FH972_023835 [Carpinus fangiana]|uniref:Asl1-like glycosyl hydrolase catalytic domain-containing protein n=1 Tax=Carpinus fangiana TaxID=176857 RepID=A0A5N6KWP3_9ROSI|nr:hypothetical protein FH972_023835 [Carpinus fangiana]